MVRLFREITWYYCQDKQHDYDYYWPELTDMDGVNFTYLLYFAYYISWTLIMIQLC